MTNDIPDSSPSRRISRPVPKASDFAPFDHSQTDRTRNSQRGMRSTRRRRFTI